MIIIMKKILLTVFVLVLSLGTVNLQAYQENGVKLIEITEIYVGSGVTECGLEFSVFKLSSENQNITSRQISDSTFITRRVYFRGNVTPQASIPWSEFFSGRTWGGTLQLVSHHYFASDNTTVGTYSGIVWATH